MTTSKQQRKLVQLLDKLVHEKKNGNRVRQVANIVAKAYEDRADLLKRAIESEKHRDSLLAGVASSAYAQIKNFDDEAWYLIQNQEYGGLGIKINGNNGKGRDISKTQLAFSDISGKAMKNANLTDDALFHARVGGDSFSFSESKKEKSWYRTCVGRGAEISDNAFAHSETEESFDDSIISGSAFSRSINGGHGFIRAKISEQAFSSSTNNNGFADAHISDQTFPSSTNYGGFAGAHISDQAFRDSINRGDSFKCAELLDRSFDRAKNDDSSFESAEIRGEAQRQSTNLGDSFHHAEMRDSCFNKAVFCENSGKTVKIYDDSLYGIRATQNAFRYANIYDGGEAVKDAVLLDDTFKISSIKGKRELEPFKGTHFFDSSKENIQKMFRWYKLSHGIGTPK